MMDVVGRLVATFTITIRYKWINRFKDPQPIDSNE